VDVFEELLGQGVKRIVIEVHPDRFEIGGFA
jgi:hypothetical protein